MFVTLEEILFEGDMKLHNNGLFNFNTKVHYGNRTPT